MPLSPNDVALSARVLVSFAARLSTFRSLSGLYRLIEAGFSSLSFFPLASNLVSELEPDMGSAHHDGYVYVDSHALYDPIGPLVVARHDNFDVCPFLTTSKVKTPQVVRMLRMLHQGFLLWRTFLERMLAQVVCKPAAWTISRFVCGSCSCEQCCRRPDEIRDVATAASSSCSSSAKSSECPRDQIAWPLELVTWHEDPSVISPEEASLTQDELYASYIQHRVATSYSSVSVDRFSADVPHSETSRKIVLLTFSRISAALDAALLGSSFAEVNRSQGFDVMPNWARGAKVFVHKLGPQHLEPASFPELMPRHAFLYEHDVEDLLEELQAQLPYSLRKVKPHDCLPVLPEELSLMDVSQIDSDGIISCDDSESQSNGAIGNQELDVEVVVRHTFFELSLLEVEPRSVLSACSAEF